MRPSPFLAAALCLLPFAARAQEAKRAQVPDERARDEAPAAKSKAQSKFKTRQELAAHYEDRFAEVDKDRIKDLAALAATLKEAEAEAVYSELFNLAVTRDQYEAAERAAEAFLDSGKGSTQTKALASFVNIIAATNRGKYDEGIKDLDLFLKGMTSADPKAAPIDPNLMFAVGEAFVQKLIKAGEYEAARQVCTTFVDGAADPNVKGHFAGRLERINMLGKPAPAIDGEDVDKKKVSLVDYKGKVVLVDFWATWAPPCVAQMPYYSALQQKYGPKGFQVLGVNVDGANANVKDKTQVAAGVRRFLLGMRVGWPTILNGTGERDFAKAFGVTDIPANFLIGRDGKILQVELSDIDLDKAIAKAVGGDEKPKEKATR